MKVRAIGTEGKVAGFYGNRRIYPGQEFEIDPKAFSKKWMEKLEKRGRKVREPDPEPVISLSEPDE